VWLDERLRFYLGQPRRAGAYFVLESTKELLVSFYRLDAGFIWTRLGVDSTVRAYTYPVK